MCVIGHGGAREEVPFDIVPLRGVLARDFGRGMVSVGENVGLWQGGGRQQNLVYKGRDRMGVGSTSALEESRSEILGEAMVEGLGWRRGDSIALVITLSDIFVVVRVFFEGIRFAMVESEMPKVIFELIVAENRRFGVEERSWCEE